MTNPAFRNGTQSLPQKPMTLDEFKPLPCLECGCVRRQALSWVEVMVHRFSSHLKPTATKTVTLCLGCRKQISQVGAAVPPEDPDFLKPEERDILLGRG